MEGRPHRPQPAARFTFDGKPLSGFAGDTLASALLANGNIWSRAVSSITGRAESFGAGSEEPNGLFTIGKEAGAPEHPGNDDRSRSTASSPQAKIAGRRSDFDLMAVNSLFAPFLSAGFYYKTFMGPFRKSWMFYEPFIRRAAGLGRASEKPDPDRYEVRHEFCDVLVVGAGPAGLAAAIAAADAGARGCR